MSVTVLTKPEIIQTAGRSKELALLRRTLEELRGGTGGCVMIEGPGGIGKSHLLEAAASEAAQQDIRIIAAGAAGGSPAQHTGGLDFAAHLAARFAADPGGSGPVDPAEARVRELALTEGPFVLTLDDIDGADEATARRLAALVSRTETLPVLWLLARKPALAVTATSRALEEIASHHAVRLRLGPLEEAAVDEMAAAAFGAPMEPRLAELVHRSGGAPALVKLLLDALSREGLVRIRGQRASLRSDELPRRVLDAVALKMHELSDDARWLVSALAVFDRPCTLHEAGALVGRSTLDIVAAVHEALSQGVLVERDGGVDFCYPLTRDATYDNLPETTRMALHREAATLLQRDGSCGTDEVARHITLGSRPGEDTTGRLFAFLERTAHSPQGITDSVRLLATAGHHEEARALVASVLRGAGPDGPDTAVKVRTLLAVASVWLYTGRNDGLTAQAVRHLGESELPAPQRSQLLVAEAVAHLCDNDTEAAVATGRRALRQGEEDEDVLSRLLADMLLSRCALESGDLDEAVIRACEGMHLAQLGGRETAHHYPHLMMASALAAHDELAEAEIMLRLGEQQAVRKGDTWLRPMWHYQRALLRLSAGRLAEAEEAAETAASAVEPSSPVGSAVLALLSHLALLRDDISTARYHLRCASLGPFDTMSSAPEDLVWRRGLLRRAEGDTAGAFKALRPLYDTLPARPRLLTREPGAAAILVGVARCAGSREHAATVVAVMRDLTSRHPSIGSLQGAAMHAEGVLRDDLRLVERSHEERRLTVRPLALAAALEDSGVLLRRTGDQGGQQTTTRLRQALCLYEKAGASFLARRVRGRLAEQPARPNAAQTSGTVPGWESLTEAERRVGILVAEGLTNREVAKRLFLSPHTVDSHLRQCFAKFAVNNRVELTRAVVEHHTPDDPENT
ncbi:MULTISPECIES: AAA family ATPase [unclassified Streptomyces]|uniref:AAA family ATPase n=1 Tax=unclassified Streptomyces TaxID=2593676 RepID=UPI002DD9CAB6|nr:AAA family ATPase [Streptomyces sp. NBC_01775]WSB75518.1 AAA family ATPase [Streptomyces sp. NBC_01775]WSS45017.1 AAA family ATPase [Streptomyces sp. NBC_01187]